LTALCAVNHPFVSREALSEPGERNIDVSGSGDLTQFSGIDESGDPDYFERFLERVASLPGIQQARAAMVAALHLNEGQRILDAGSGRGECVVELARMVGPRGLAVGIDASREMLARARARPEAQGLPAAFLLGDVHRLPFEDASFDASRAERLLVSVADPEQALHELVRIVKPGGRVVVQDVDNETFFVDTPFPETTRAIVRALSDAESNGTIGRCLPRLFRDQGLVETQVSSFVLLVGYDLFELAFEGILARAQEAGTLSCDDSQAWWDYLREANEAGRFFAGETVFVVAGTRPD